MGIGRDGCTWTRISSPAPIGHRPVLRSSRRQHSVSAERGESRCLRAHTMAAAIAEDALLGPDPAFRQPPVGARHARGRCTSPATRCSDDSAATCGFILDREFMVYAGVRIRPPADATPRSVFLLCRAEALARTTTEHSLSVHASRTRRQAQGAPEPVLRCATRLQPTQIAQSHRRHKESMIPSDKYRSVHGQRVGTSPSARKITMTSPYLRLTRPLQID